MCTTNIGLDSLFQGLVETNVGCNERLLKDKAMTGHDNITCGMNEDLRVLDDLELGYRIDS